MWLAFWAFFFMGLFVIGVTVYDYIDCKKRGNKRAMWKYALAVVIGLILMFPVVSAMVIVPPRIFR